MFPESCCHLGLLSLPPGIEQVLEHRNWHKLIFHFIAGKVWVNMGGGCNLMQLEFSASDDMLWDVLCVTIYRL
jgi:hypothetical protein